MSTEQIHQLRLQIMDIRGQIAALQKDLPTETVTDYSFESADGAVQLSALFGEHNSLFLVHNMGTSCNYCMLWADGFNGVADHLQNRASFVISSPDSPLVQQQYKADRGWNFRMISCANNTFAQDMGFNTENGYLPGVSVFQRQGESIVRVASTMFGPGDDFCAVWHLFDLLPQGSDGWQPQTNY